MEHSQSITFNQLNQEYISRLKDAFQMFDDDGDGQINKEDLIKSLNNVGKIISEDDPLIEEMLGGRDVVSFAQFLNIMSEKSGEFDEDTLEESLSLLSSGEKTSKLEMDETELIRLIRENGVEDMKEFDKIFQTFAKKGIFSGRQFLDTISEK